MSKYNWQQKDWLQFKFSLEVVEQELLTFIEKLGKYPVIWKACLRKQSRMFEAARQASCLTPVK